MANQLAEETDRLLQRVLENDGLMVPCRDVLDYMVEHALDGDRSDRYSEGKNGRRRLRKNLGVNEHTSASLLDEACEKLGVRVSVDELNIFCRRVERVKNACGYLKRELGIYENKGVDTPVVKSQLDVVSVADGW